jgi:TonB family protein
MNLRALSLLAVLPLLAAAAACAPRASAETADAPAWGSIEGSGAPRLTAESRRLLPGRMRTLYPSLLRDAGITGSAEVRFTVTADGNVDASSIRVSNATHPDFQQATWQIVRDLRWTAGTDGGGPTAVPMTGRFRFDPRGSDASFRPAR